mmetsp:Transcript_69407/g.201112  ORF Transcript_69407/g.201112 Transcript_69407/m.201112 type:complete len:614 (+) Transcript_69407:44-1885(+)
MAHHGCKVGIQELCDHSEDYVIEDIQRVYAFGLGSLVVGLILHAILHRKRWETIPESLVTVLLGVLLGFILCWSDLLGESGHLDQQFIRAMFSGCLNLVALPVIIFESGWSVRIRDFVSQFGYIMVFAIIGTLAAVAIIAALLMWTSDFHSIHDGHLALAMASLISSVDPVSTLATFGHLNVDPLLFILIFGESQINDAVAITLFRSFNRPGAGMNWRLLVDMLKVFFGSIGVGVGLAIVILLIFRCGQVGQAPAQSVLLIFVSCFFTFQVGEICGLSGIIAVLFNSILLGCYASLYLSHESMALTSFLLKQMSSLADSLIFLFCGVMGVFVCISRGSGFKLGVLLSGICLVARVLTIIPLGVVSNCVKKRVGRHLPKEKTLMISWKHLAMMCHSGLRGGVSLVLVSELRDTWVSDAAKQQLVNATFVMVVLYLLVFGSTTGLALRCLGLPLGDEVDEGSMLYSEEDKQGFAWRIMICLQETFMPILVPRKADEAEDSEKVDTVMADAIREAGEAEIEARTSSRRLTRTLTTRTIRAQGVMIDLFGSTDPTHMGSKCSVLQEIRQWRSSAVGSSAMIDGGLSGALSDVESSDKSDSSGSSDDQDWKGSQRSIS